MREGNSETKAFAPVALSYTVLLYAQKYRAVGIPALPGKANLYNLSLYRTHDPQLALPAAALLPLCL